MYRLLLGASIMHRNLAARVLADGIDTQRSQLRRVSHRSPGSSAAEWRRNVERRCRSTKWTAAVAVAAAAVAVGLFILMFGNQSAAGERCGGGGRSGSRRYGDALRVRSAVVNARPSDQLTN
jgi:hypothetical protein